jgi:hypothetical protein
MWDPIPLQESGATTQVRHTGSKRSKSARAGRVAGHRRGDP